MPVHRQMDRRRTNLNAMSSAENNKARIKGAIRASSNSVKFAYMSILGLYMLTSPFSKR